MNIKPDAANVARSQLLGVFEKLDERLNKRQFLAGEQFSRADLCAAGLMFHRWSPNWSAPPHFDEFMREVHDRPFFRWARDIYRDYRGNVVK